jgi:hypothetical protein
MQMLTLNKNTAGALAFLLACVFSTMAVASAACSECRAFQKPCLKAHPKEACRNDYDICMKHCRQNKVFAAEF